MRSVLFKVDGLEKKLVRIEMLDGGSVGVETV
jgi:hypothetical protein